MRLTSTIRDCIGLLPNEVLVMILKPLVLSVQVARVLKPDGTIAPEGLITSAVRFARTANFFAANRRFWHLAAETYMIYRRNPRIDHYARVWGMMGAPNGVLAQGLMGTRVFREYGRKFELTLRVYPGAYTADVLSSMEQMIVGCKSLLHVDVVLEWGACVVDMDVMEARINKVFERLERAGKRVSMSWVVRSIV